MDRSQVYIIIDALLYLITFVYWLNKIRTMNTGIVILLIMTISHFAAFFYYTTLRDLGFMNYEIQLIPCIYLYLMILLSIYPFLTQKDIVKIDDFGNRKVIKYLSILAIILNVEPLVENIFLLFTSQNDYSELYDGMREGTLDLYSGIGSLLMGWSSHFKIFTSVAFFYYLAGKTKNRVLIIGLFACMINYILYWINCGGRGGVVSQLLIYFLTFILFKQLLPKDKLKKLAKIAVMITVPLVVVFVLISSSRHEKISEKSTKMESVGLVGGIIFYVSEGPVRFNTEMWDGKHNTKGDVNFNYLKDKLGLKTYITYEDRDVVYLSKNGRRVEVFYTYVGDFVSDLGIIGGFIACLVLSIVSKRLICRYRCMPFQNLLILVFILHIYSIGFAANIYRAYGLQRSIMYTFLLFFVMSILNNKPHKFIAK